MLPDGAAVDRFCTGSARCTHRRRAAPGEAGNAGKASPEGEGNWATASFENLVQYNDGFRCDLVGTPPQVARRIVALMRAGADLVRLGFLHFQEEVEAFGRTVIPLVRELEEEAEHRAVAAQQRGGSPPAFAGRRAAIRTAGRGDGTGESRADSRFMRPTPDPTPPLFPPPSPLPPKRREARGAAPAAGEDPLRARAMEIHRRLCPVYGCPIPYFHDLDPLSELVSSLLSHRTRNADSGRAYKALRARFPTWDAVIVAPAAQVETAIQGVRWPEQKAPRIQAVLRAVRERGGALDLGFLADMTVDAARTWLEAIPGVGPKTSAAVLSFSVLRMPALPVDSHHHRVAQRLGLIGARVDVGPSHPILRAQLPADWSAQNLYDNHEILMLHGQKVCHFRRPDCGTCVLADICPSAFDA